MNRRVLTITIIGVVILLLIGGVLIWSGKRPSHTQTVAKPLQIKKISDAQVIAPTLATGNDGIWYFTSTGQLYKVGLDGSGLFEYPLPTPSVILLNALWPKTGSDFLTITSNPQTTQTTFMEAKSYYDSTHKDYVNLAANVQSLDWLPDGLRIIYVWKSSDNVHQSLVISNADGNGYHKVADLFWSDLQVKAAPDGRTALLYRLDIQGDINKIYQVDLSSGAISTVIEQGKNLGAVWFPNTDKFLYTQTAAGAQYPKLFLYDLASKLSTDLNLDTTLDKVVISSDGKFLYAAVPKPDNSGDNFVKVDLTTDKAAVYFAPTQPVRASSLVLAGSTLYYVDTQDGQLYSLQP